MKPAISKPALIEQHSATKPDMVALGRINHKSGTQLRVDTDKATVAEYADLYRTGGPDALPPIVVFLPKGQDAKTGDLILADGHHRRAAAKVADLKKIPAIVKRGDRRDALLYAAGANHSHGLRLTNHDKLNIVTVLLADPEWLKLSDRNLAELAHVSPNFVGKIRKAAHGAQSAKTRTGKDGRKVNVAKIGKRAKPAPAKAPAADEDPNFHDADALSDVLRDSSEFSDLPQVQRRILSACALYGATVDTPIPAEILRLHASCDNDISKENYLEGIDRLLDSDLLCTSPDYSHCWLEESLLLRLTAIYRADSGQRPTVLGTAAHAASGGELVVLDPTDAQLAVDPVQAAAAPPASNDPASYTAGPDGSEWNQHGVATRCESVTLPAPKSSKFSLVVKLAQAPAGGWRLGYDFQKSNGAGSGCGPSQNGPIFPDRARALWEGCQLASRFVRDHGGKQPIIDGILDIGRAACGILTHADRARLRVEHIATQLADHLDGGKAHFKGTQQQLLALILITGLQDTESDWSPKLVEDAEFFAHDAIAREIASHLRVNSDKVAKLPDLQQLCTLFGRDHDDLRIIAANALPEAG